MQHFAENVGEEKDGENNKLALEESLISISSEVENKVLCYNGNVFCCCCCN